MASNSVKRYICNLGFAELDFPIKCEGCTFLTHDKCSGLNNSEIKCLGFKNRNLKFFCEACNNGLRDIPELKLLINRLLPEVNELKSQKNNNNVQNHSEEFIIGEVGERNIRLSNLIFYNVPESNLDNAVGRVNHDSNLVINIIDSIITDGNIRPSIVIRLGIHGKNNPRPIKAVFSTPADVFEILKSKKKFLSLQPPSTIGISSDRTLYQRNSMKKLRNELESRRTNGEIDLIIKYIRGTPTIVTKDNRSNARNGNFF